MVANSNWEVGPGYRVVPEIINIFSETVDRHVEEGRGDAIAVVSMERHVTFRELQAEASAVAAALRGFAVSKGDRVLVISRNTLAAVTTILAALKIGAVPVLANSMLPANEIDYVLEDCGASVAFAAGSAVNILRQFAQDGRITRLIVLDGPVNSEGEDYSVLVSGGGRVPTVATSASDPAFMVYSSGTTGRPKGIVHGHKWIVTVGDPNVLQMDFNPTDIVSTVGEISFMGNFGHAFIFPLYAGSAIALFAEKVTPSAVLEFFRVLKPTIFLSVPTFYRMMLAEENFTAALRLLPFRFMVSTGEVLGESVWNRWHDETGVKIYEIYGVSEFQTLLSNGPDLPLKPGSLGKPAPGVKVALLDQSLNEVPNGTPGVLMVHRSDPGLFLEYYQDPDRWRQQHRGEWYYTGDVMQVDEDGYYFYLGRQDDLFKSRGYLISPQEIENVLQRHPGVAEVAVVGHPDALTGNAIVAYVVLDASQAPSEALKEEILAFVSQLIAQYKMPKVLNFVGEIPKSPVGKILRRALRGGPQENNTEPAA